MIASRSKQLGLDEVTAGMVLSDDLLDGHGQVLLPKGATLTETTLASLRRHAVETLPILCEELSEADLETARERYRQRLSSLFRKHTNDEATALLLQYVTHFRLGA